MTDRQEDPIRAQLIKARRAQILDAAAEVFAEKGFARATTKEVASRAGVSEGTIYNYFGNKEKLLMGLMAHVAELQLGSAGFTFAGEHLGDLESLQDRATLQENVDAQEFFIKLLRWRHSFVAQYRPMLHALLAEMLANTEFRARYNEQLLKPFVSLFEQQLQTRVEQGQLRSVDVSLVLRFMLAINLGMIGLLILGDPLLEEKWESEELVRKLTDFIMRGIGAQDKEEATE